MCFIRMGMLGCGPVKYSLHQDLAETKYGF
jgi:hypothetical protein